MAATDTVNPDLAKERQNATFDPEQLTNFIYGGPEKTRRKRYLRECNILSRLTQNIHIHIYIYLYVYVCVCVCRERESMCARVHSFVCACVFEDVATFLKSLQIMILIINENV